MKEKNIEEYWKKAKEILHRIEQTQKSGHIRVQSRHRIRCYNCKMEANAPKIKRQDSYLIIFAFYSRSQTGNLLLQNTLIPSETH